VKGHHDVLLVRLRQRRRQRRRRGGGAGLPNGSGRERLAGVYHTRFVIDDRPRIPPDRRPTPQVSGTGNAQMSGGSWPEGMGSKRCLRIPSSATAKKGFGIPAVIDARISGNEAGRSRSMAYVAMSSGSSGGLGRGGPGQWERLAAGWTGPGGSSLGRCDARAPARADPRPMRASFATASPSPGSTAWHRRASSLRSWSAVRGLSWPPHREADRRQRRRGRHRGQVRARAESALSGWRPRRRDQPRRRAGAAAPRPRQSGEQRTARRPRGKAKPSEAPGATEADAAVVTAPAPVIEPGLDRRDRVW